MKGGLYREEDMGQYSCHDVLTSYCGLETAMVLQQEGLFKCLNSIRCLGHGTKAKQEIDLITKCLQLAQEEHKQKAIDIKHKLNA